MPKYVDTYYYFLLLSACNVEISEFANELKCFKYWKYVDNFVNIDKEKCKEELIDVLHFSLSICNYHNIKLDPDTRYIVDLVKLLKEALFRYGVEGIRVLSSFTLFYFYV